MLENSVILVTGGTRSFGHAFIPMTLKKYNPKRFVNFSRDEMKKWLNCIKMIQGFAF